MVLTVVKYGTPVLRQKGARVEAVTLKIKKLVEDMLETTYAYKGIGLAAQQVGVAMQVTVLDVRGVTDRPSTLEVNGKPVDVASLMPMALINPEVKPVRGAEDATGPEGCLSFPEIFADITRPAEVDVKALNQQGEPFEFRCGGLLARAVQHETDHLNGILFIDRMDRATKEQLRSELEMLQAETKALLKK
jgi:peptide deformylase